VKYAYQEWPYPADTASPHSQNVERRREHGFAIIRFLKKMPQTINESDGLPNWNGQ
jgi:hypothetical protein